MAKLSEIMSFIEAELRPGEFSDSGINGLQFEGRQNVNKIACAVDTGIEVIEKCLRAKADLLLVHHGLFWGPAHPVVGARRRLYKSILENDLNLVAMHLPLDAHPTYGNNHLLAQMIDLDHVVPAANYKGKLIGCIGENGKGLNRGQIKERLELLGGEAQSLVSLEFGPEIPKRICIVSGSAADQLNQFEAEGFDTFISGEPKQFAYHFCRDNGLNAIFAGHYATETVGVKALAAAIAARFAIEWEFLDIPTGI